MPSSQRTGLLPVPQFPSSYKRYLDTNFQRLNNAVTALVDRVTSIENKLTGSGATDWTPTFYQNGASVSFTDNFSEYWKIDDQIFATVDLTITGTGAAGVIELTFPETLANASSLTGSFRFFEAGVTNWAGYMLPWSTSRGRFVADQNGNALGATFAVGANDRLQCGFRGKV